MLWCDVVRRMIGGWFSGRFFDVRCQPSYPQSRSWALSSSMALCIGLVWVLSWFLSWSLSRSGGVECEITFWRVVLTDLSSGNVLSVRLTSPSLARRWRLLNEIHSFFILNIYIALLYENY